MTPESTSNEIVIDRGDLQKQRMRPSRRRTRVYEKCEGTCFYCAARLDPLNFEIEHMTPVIQRGGSALSNLVPACKTCNRSKRGRTVEQYKEYLRGRILRACGTSRETLYRLFTTTPPAALEEIHQLLDRVEELAAVLEINFIGEFLLTAEPAIDCPAPPPALATRKEVSRQ